MRNIVQIDDCLHCQCLAIFFDRRIIRGKANLRAAKSNRFCDQQLGQRTAIRTAALLCKDLQDIWVGQRFDGKIFLKRRRPGKRLHQTACIGADRRFVIKMKWCAENAAKLA